MIIILMELVIICLQVLADEQKKLYPDCWKRKRSLSSAASNSTQTSSASSGDFDDDCDFKPAPGPDQSPGLSPHPVFHPPSSPGENFHQNKIRLSPTRPTIRNASNQIIIIIITMIRNATNPDPTWTSSLLSLAGLTRIPTPSPGEKKHDFNKKI